MLLELEEFLNSTAPHETKHLIADTIDLLDKYNYNSYNDYLLSILMTVEDKDNLQILDEIVENFRLMVKSVLSEHSIFLVDEVPLKDAGSILSGLHDLENTEQFDFVNNILDSNDSNEEIIAILIAAHSDITSDECLLYIETVTPSIVRAMKELFKGKVEFKPTSLIDEQKNRENKIIRIKKLIDDKECYIGKLIRSGVKIDMTFDSYTSLYKDDIMEMQPPEVAHALVGFALMSSDQSEAPITFLNDYVTANFSSLNDFTKINTVMKELYSKVNAF